MPLIVNIICKILKESVVRKNAKRNWNNIRFSHIFVIRDVSIAGAQTPSSPPPPRATPMRGAPGALEIFEKSSCLGEDQKKFYHMKAGPLTLCHMVNPPWLLHYVHKKIISGPEIATFRTKTLNFIRVTLKNWLAKIKLRGAGPQIVNIIVHYCCTHVCDTRKMLKETEETIDFLPNFYHKRHFNCYVYGKYHNHG